MQVAARITIAGESEEVVRTFRDQFNIRLVHRDASDLFVNALESVTDPETKRKTIGRVFIDVEGTRDRLLDLEAVAGGQRAAMGQTLSAHAGETIIVSAAIGGVAQGIVQLVIDGNAEAVVNVTDVWTFARTLGTRDPNWQLVATEAGQ